MHIPKPPTKKDIPKDMSGEYLKKWKELLISIDPEQIVIYLENDQNFPNWTTLEMNLSRLDGYSTDIHILLRFKESHLSATYGKEIYFCDRNVAYGSNWITELDNNLDTLIDGGRTTWKMMYSILVKDMEAFFKRIPKPPEEATDTKTAS